MNTIRLLKAVGAVDDELLSAYEADAGSPRRRPAIWLGAAAALLCLVIVGALTLPALLNPSTPGEGLADHPPTQTELPREDNAPLIIDGSSFSSSASNSYVAPSPGEILYFIEVEAAMEEYAGTDAQLFLAIDLMTDDLMLDEDSPEVAEEVARMQNLGYDVFYNEAWTYEGDGNQIPYTYLAGLFTVEQLESFQTSDSFGYAFRFAVNGDGSSVTPTDTSAAITEVVPAQESPLELTEEEAYAAIGAFLPQAAPSGFSFASASYLDSTVSVLWSNGDGSLHWSVRDYSDEDADRLTTAANTAAYDLSLYSIPWVDSVPPELMEIVEDPIFDFSEVTEQIVQARAYTVDETGDSGATRMRFCVRYGEMLVALNAKDVSPEWVYQALIAINPEG